MVSLGATSAYALEKKVNPGGMRRTDEGTFYHSSRWACYQKGRSVPRAEAVELVEALSAGSSRTLNHPLWEFLRKADKPLQPQQTGAWLRELSTGHRRLLFHASEASIRADIRKGVSDSVRRKLSKLPGLDTVLALSIQLKEASELGRGKLAFELGETLFALMVRWALVADDRIYPLVADLFDVLGQRVMPLATDGRKRICLDDFDAIRLFEIVRRARSPDEVQRDRYDDARQWLGKFRVKTDHMSLMLGCPVRPVCTLLSDLSAEQNYRTLIEHWRVAVARHQEVRGG